MSSASSTPSASTNASGFTGAGTLCLANMFNHMALTGGRVTVALGALQLGMSTFKVGALIALFAILPMLFSVKAGRWVDRVGVQRPLYLGTAILLSGTVVPALSFHPIALLIASCCIGIGFMLHQVATQNVLGLAAPAIRLRNFSWMSLALGASGFCGPLIGGLAIDHAGSSAAFACLAVGPLCAAGILYRLRRALALAAPAAPANEAPRRVTELLAVPALRRVLLVNTILSGAWDTHLFVVPLYGNAIGLSATAIGVVLAAFAGATFIIRLLLPLIQRRVTSWTLIRITMGITVAIFAIYPFLSDFRLLIAFSFILGLALGSSQPGILALLHQYSPRGRAAEAVGLRMALINASQVSLPLTFGALGAAIGVAPLFWAYAVMLAVAGWFNREPPSDA